MRSLQQAKASVPSSEWSRSSTSISNQTSTWLSRRESRDSGQPPGPQGTAWRPVHSSAMGLCVPGEGGDKGTWRTSSRTEVADPTPRDPISWIPRPQDPFDSLICLTRTPHTTWLCLRGFTR